MDFKLGRINLNKVAKGVGGFVFGNEKFDANDDSYVERLLQRISNVALPEDRIAALDELQSVVAESRSAQLAFGATGISIVMRVLKEESKNTEMVQGALETLISALTPIDPAKELKNEVHPTHINSDLLSREVESISLLLSFLAEEDFYVRYYTLQLLTAIVTNSRNRLQEAILTIPRGITRLMDMLMDREVIRNEALLLLTYLTREAEEIQKIVVFEGAFEKIFSIVKEEGDSEGGVVVQDCLELLGNLLHNSASNQILLRETTGFEPLISILKLQGSAYKFTKQKTVNLLSTLETIKVLLIGGPETEPGRDSNRLSNQTILGQKKVMDYLLMLGVESQWAAVDLRCAALECIGNLIVGNRQNLDALASKVLGEEPNIEPALNSILRIILRTTSVEEFVAADFVFKCFCEKNNDGQAMLASTMIPQPHTMTNAPLEDDINMSFGSMLLHGLSVSETDGDLETCCRAASVLSHILKDNFHCKERVLQLELEASIPSLGAPEPIMHRIVKYLALSSSKNKDSDHKSITAARESYIQPIILQLLVTWLADCPNAVQSFLVLRPHLTFLLELVSSLSVSVCTRGLAAVLLGECVLYNKSADNSRDASMVVDAISQKVGLTSFLLKFDEMLESFVFVSAKLAKPHKPLRSDSLADLEDISENDVTDRKHGEHPVLMSLFDTQFVNNVEKLEENIRENIMYVYSHPKTEMAVVPAELEQKSGENDGDYIKRLKSCVEKQCTEMQDLLGRNATLAEELAKRSGSGTSESNQTSRGRETSHAHTDTDRRDLQEALQQVEILKSEKHKIEAESSMYHNWAIKMESDLKSLSDAYNCLEQANSQLESQVNALTKGGNETYPDLEAIKENAKEEGRKESETELNDLLVCLGQEQSKVEKLSSRLVEMGEDISSLLEGVGDDAGIPQDSDEDEDEDEDEEKD